MKLQWQISAFGCIFMVGFVPQLEYAQSTSKLQRAIWQRI
jgi:hypothetical protein